MYNTNELNLFLNIFALAFQQTIHDVKPKFHFVDIPSTKEMEALDHHKQKSINNDYYLLSFIEQSLL